MQQWWQLSFVVVLGLLNVLLSAAADAQQAKHIGRVTGLEGKVTVLHSGKFAPEPLTLHKAVFQEDIVETERASKVRITLTDATVISLGEQSRLELKHLSHDARQQTRSARLAISLGFFRAVLQQLIPSSSFEVTTPTAVAAIRGTDLMGEVSADATAIVALEGTVTVSNIRPHVGGLSTLTAGMGTTVTRDEPPSPPTRWAEPRIEGLRGATALP
jgi:hypothetical protein